MKRLTISILVLALAGCAAMADTRLRGERMTLEERGFPPQYNDGYVDGCSSGTAASGASAYRFRKDVNRFDVDSKYRQGWSDGYQVCKANADRLSF